jgi:hypothetical protein
VGQKLWANISYFRNRAALIKKIYGRDTPRPCPLTDTVRKHCPTSESLNQRTRNPCDDSDASGGRRKAPRSSTQARPLPVPVAVSVAPRRPRLCRNRNSGRPIGPCGRSESVGRTPGYGWGLGPRGTEPSATNNYQIAGAENRGNLLEQSRLAVLLFLLSSHHSGVLFLNHGGALSVLLGLLDLTH